jgi:hypothetical protein
VNARSDVVLGATGNAAALITRPVSLVILNKKVHLN